MGVRQDLESGTAMATSENCRHCPLVDEKEWIGSAMQVVYESLGIENGLAHGNALIQQQ